MVRPRQWISHALLHSGEDDRGILSAVEYHRTCWYRGYFKEDLTQQQVEQSLKAVGANAVVVGHTLQGKVNARFNGKVFVIDVRLLEDGGVRPLDVGAP